MREASLKDISEFLECKRVAFVGVSRNPQHISRALFREFVAQGYDPVPVNPQAAEIGGRTCFAGVSDINPSAEAALLFIGAQETIDQLVRECNQAGIKKIWIYKNVTDGGDHAQTVELCRSDGSAVVEGYCPFMFLPHPALVHRIHRFVAKVTGSYPR